MSGMPAPAIARRAQLFLAAACPILGAPAIARAADEPTAPAPPPTLRPIEQGVADRDPLSTSLRIIQPGLDEPSGFDQVFEVPGHPGLLMRRDGALSAVFTRSEYTKTKRNIVVLVPAGTVYYIGDVVAQLDAAKTTAPTPAASDPSLASPSTAAPIRLVSNRLSLLVGEASPGLRLYERTDAPANARDEPPAAPARAPEPVSIAAPPGVPPTVWTSEVYRRSRLAQILSAAGRSPGPAPTPIASSNPEGETP